MQLSLETSEVLHEALKYALQTLELEQRDAPAIKLERERPGHDIEAAKGTNPNTVAFASFFGGKITDMFAGKEDRIRTFIAGRDMLQSQPEKDVHLSLLFVMFQSEHLLHSLRSAVQALVAFADSKVSDGTMTSTRIIAPRVQELSSWLWETVTFGLGHAGVPSGLGHAPQSQKDPDHLPPRNRIERLGEQLRGFSEILQSPNSTFAFRIACAVLTTQILAYIRQMQIWYNVQRIFWASISIAIATNRTAGQSGFNVLINLVATLAACLASLVVWYMVDGYVAGVMIFFFIAVMSMYYPSLRNPMYSGFTLIGAVTLALLIGYELESERIGQAAVEATGQPYYSPYILSWIRLLIVVAGLIIAYFWTMFPYPVLEQTELRQELSKALFTLAQLHMQTYFAVNARMQGRVETGDVTAEMLDDESVAVSRTLIATTGQLRVLLGNTRYQIQVGGRFPHETYAKLIDTVDSLFRSTTLVYYSSRAFAKLADTRSAWLDELRRTMSANETNELQTVSALSLCASAVANKQPLPPYIDAPDVSELLKPLRNSPMELLGTQHALEPGYAALGVLHVSSMVVTADLRRVVELTADLVGQMDFGFTNAKYDPVKTD